MKNKFLFLCMLLSVAITWPLLAQNTIDSMQSQEAPVKHKAYQYSEATMHFEQMLESFESVNRVEWQNPELVLKQLGSLEGKTVADIGAGSGYFTFRLARFARKVIAVDIDYRFLEYIENKKSELNEGVACQIETRLAAPHDAALFENEIDVALLVNTYPFIQQREQYFKKLSKSLKKKGFIIIVSFKPGDIPVGPPEKFKLSALQVANELQKAGYSIESVDNVSLPYQYIVKARL